MSTDALDIRLPISIPVLGALAMAIDHMWPGATMTQPYDHLHVTIDTSKKARPIRKVAALELVDELQNELSELEAAVDDLEAQLAEHPAVRILRAILTAGAEDRPDSSSYVDVATGVIDVRLTLDAGQVAYLQSLSP